MPGLPATSHPVGFLSGIYDVIAEHEGETKVMCASVQKSPFLRALTLGLSDVAVFFVGAALAALAYVVKRAGGECGETVVVLVEVFFSYVFAALAWLTHALDFVTCGLLSALHLLLCELSTGLVPGHAYTVLAVRAVPILCLPAMDSQRLAASCLTSKFVKLRNPWGAMAWKGAYGRGSLLWRLRPGLAQVRRARAAPSKRAMRSHARARAHRVLAASAAHEKRPSALAALGVAALAACLPLPRHRQAVASGRRATPRQAPALC